MSVTVTKAAPYLTIQDFGRLHFREFGVPRSGAMDRSALGAANVLVGNQPDTAGLEWALGGGSLRFDEPCAFALAGAIADGTLAGRAVPTLTTMRANAGDVLDIGRFTRGRFLYVAVNGGFAVEELLGSRSTYLPRTLVASREGSFALARNCREDRRRKSYAKDSPPRMISELIILAERFA